MKRLALALALLGTPALAQASEAFYRLYDVDPKALDPHAVEAVSKLERDCAYSMMSRLGPSPRQAAACDAQVKKVAALGSAGARAALAQLDTEHGGFGGRSRLYDVVARAGDLGFVEPLVKALEREEAEGLGNPRHYERNSISNALAALTYAEVKGTPAIQWRAWVDAHHGVDRATLLAERATEVESKIATGTVEEISSGARFIAFQGGSPLRARKILTAYAARTDLSFADRHQVKLTLDNIPSNEPRAAQKPGPQTALRTEIPRS